MRPTATASDPEDDEPHDPSPEQERVVACLERMSEKYREVILLRNFTGGSWESVASQMGLRSAAAARTLHARAVIELGNLLRGSDAA